MAAPSSLKPTTPDAASSSSATSCSPARPTVAAATTRTRAAASAAQFVTHVTRAGSSRAGSVFGMAQTVA